MAPEGTIEHLWLQENCNETQEYLINKCSDSICDFIYDSSLPIDEKKVIYDGIGIEVARLLIFLLQKENDMDNDD